MSVQRSLEQERASEAWKCVYEVKKCKGDYKKEYSQLARGAVGSVLTNGLGQTLAFWRAKGSKGGEPKNDVGNAHGKLCQHVSSWLRTQLGIQSNDLLAWIVNDASIHDYRRATAEAIAFLGWLKRFAEAELGD